MEKNENGQYIDVPTASLLKQGKYAQGKDLLSVRMIFSAQDV